MDQATRDAFAGLQKTVERGFAAVAEDLTGLRSEFKSEIAALHAELKGDVASIGQRLDGIEAALQSIRRDLNDLAQQVANVSDFRKEIDHALGRIAAIEKHLGIGRDIPA